MSIQYIVIKSSDDEYDAVFHFQDEKSLIEGLRNKDPDDLIIYEVKRRLSLYKTVTLKEDP